MSLTATDPKHFELANSIEKIYRKLKDIQRSLNSGSGSKSVKNELLLVNADLLAVAKQAGITLPRP